MTHTERKSRWTFVGSASLVFLLATTAFAGEDVRAAIVAANDKWEEAVSRSDGPGAAALYTADGEIFPANSEVVHGTQAIGEVLQGVFDSGIKGAVLTTVEVESCGNTAYEVGKYEFRDADGKVVDDGKYVVVWKKEGDAWKLHRDIWTTSVVPAKP